MKKCIALLLTVAMILSLAACGAAPAQPQTPSAAPAEPETPAVQEPETPAEAPVLPEEPAEPEVPAPPAEEPGPLTGILTAVNTSETALAKLVQDAEAGTATVDQTDLVEEVPVVQFVRNGYVLEGESWSISGTMTTDITYSTCSMNFICQADEKNFSEFIISRQQTGICALRRAITVDGTRMQSNLDEIVTEDLQKSASWTVDFHLIFTGGYLYLFMQEADEPMKLMTSYCVDWESCTPRLEVTKNAKVTFSNLSVSNDPAAVSEFYNSIAVVGELKGKKSLFFVGNSCLFFYDTPNTFSRLARQAGYLVEVHTALISSAGLHHFADTTTFHNKVFKEGLERQYDNVLFQVLSTSIKTEAYQQKCRLAAKVVSKMIRESGNEPMIYVRAPRNDYAGKADYPNTTTPDEASLQYEQLLAPLAEEMSIECCYLNRAWTIANREVGVNLWYKDAVHQNAFGTYLCACVLFCTMFETSCQVLDDDGLPEDVAKDLRSIADRVVLQGETPW